MRHWLFALASSSLLWGCANAVEPYHPVRPHRGATTGVEVEIVRAQISGFFQLALKTRAGAGVRLERALLAPASAPSCREGVRDNGLFVDEKLHWLRPVPIDGAHDVMLSFPHGAGLDLLE